MFWFGWEVKRLHVGFPRSDTFPWKFLHCTRLRPPSGQKPAAVLDRGRLSYNCPWRELSQDTTGRLRCCIPPAPTAYAECLPPSPQPGSLRKVLFTQSSGQCP